MTAIGLFTGMNLLVYEELVPPTEEEKEFIFNNVTVPVL